MAGSHANQRRVIISRVIASGPASLARRYAGKGRSLSAARARQSDHRKSVEFLPRIHSVEGQWFRGGLITLF
jgi:hypothetical protein